MLVVFASLNAIDGICCPDGCTRQQGVSSLQQHPESGDGICILCLGGVDSGVSHELLPSAVITNRVALPLFTHRLDAPADPPEHPPRS